VPDGSRARGEQPILVTGMPRSGTTWVARMLDAADRTAWISEPFNLEREPPLLSPPPPYWFTYLTADNEAPYVDGIDELLALRFRYGRELRAVRSRRELLDALRRWRQAHSHRREPGRPLLKEPHALFSAEWLAHRFGFEVVITVRHPLAVVSSWKRLGWPFDFGHLLAQPLLLRDWLAPYEAEMREAVGTTGVVEQASLLWRIAYEVVAQYRDRFPAFHIVRQEDVSLEPATRFATLYEALDLPLTERALSAIVESSDAANPVEVTLADPHTVRLDSRTNLENWKRRLTADEISRIREITEATARRFYGDDEWP
jgi:hypothetical protein